MLFGKVNVEFCFLGKASLLAILKSYSSLLASARRGKEVRKPPPFAKNGKWFPLPLSIGLERVVEIPILLTKRRNLSAVSFWGKQTPTTGVDKWQAR